MGNKRKIIGVSMSDTTNNNATVSIIIPTLNEEKSITKTLSSISQQTQQPIEVIIVDGESTDNTCQMVSQYNWVTLIQSHHRGRAQQMNTGANHAKGDWLLFLHADTLLPINGIAAISQLNNNAYVTAGCFTHQFSSSHCFLSIISWLHNFRCRITRIMYGDQSIFCRRKTFYSVGGYPEKIMEDIRFSEKILETHPPVLLDNQVITASRKFEQRGIIRSFLDVIIIICCYQLGRPIPNISKSFFSEIR